MKALRKKALKKEAASVKKLKVKVTIPKKIFGKAPEEHTFSLQDGRRLRTVYELIDELETMSDDVFRYYVNRAENHFANWIEHVFDEKNLAQELRALHERFDTQRALLKHLVRELIKRGHHE